MEKCAPCLEMGEVVDRETGEVCYRLHQAYFCRVRTCPCCAWRRSLRWKARMYEALPQIEAAYPTHRWLFLTLTVRNPSMAELKDTLRAMRAGWRNLVRYKEWPAIGAVRSMEVTHGQDGRPHPHFHALILVPAGYFKGQNYLRHDRWVELWRKAMKLDYAPSVHVRPVKPREGDTHPMHAAIAECLKYSIKPSDLATDQEWLWAITDELRGTRAVEVFGALKLYLAEAEAEEDLVNLSEDGAEDPGGNEGGIFFNWYPSRERYGRRRSS
jgi:plasmid rolling circle replication initiator protein Rep